MKPLLLLPLSFLTACAATVAATPALPEGPARIGETVRVDGPTVRPLAIVEDSRCPVDVACIWAGRLVIRAEIGTGRGKQEMVLTLGEPVPVADGMLTLRDATPVTRHGQPLKPGDYRFTFAFAGGF
ncbi:hypothetical protein P1X14_01280 [Sphingomonas sp. AOB5]|uniref:hypothetical protein n=1 Tax=Sphingomonas sp. AOB5 TaxID=3034017 RepID=UPI0023F9043B|nr:hypothetical protein [Sphingomonas sp. AOB5]MDF7773863.1 hypothetical protein [Sphingomonas sp. AOB5]